MTLFVFVSFLVWSCLPFKRIKGWASLVVVSLHKEDACAQDVVESMEQVGDLASLCLK